MSEFDDIDDAPTPPRRKRVSAAWVWLFVAVCFGVMATVLYFQYGVWVHPIHEPSDLDLVEGELLGRFGMPVEILSSVPVQGKKGQRLLRVKYRQQVRGGQWQKGDRVYCIEDRQILWAQDFEFWRWEVE